MPELKAQFYIGQFLPKRGIILSDWIRKYEGRVSSLHVSDGDANGFTRVGEGACRAEEAIKTALDTGVDTTLFNEYDALLVRLGKEVCRTNPLCGECCLNDICGTGADI